MCQQDTVSNINLINNITNGIIILDQKYRLVTWNAWFKRYSGMGNQQYIGKNIFEIFPGIKSTRVSDSIESAFNQGLPSVITNVFTPTPFPLYPPCNFTNNKNKNERIFQDVIISRYDEGDEHYCLIQINNVTASVVREKTLEGQILERQNIEKKLVKNEIRQQAIVNTMINGLVIFNNRGIIESFNPAALKMFGLAENSCDKLSITQFIDKLSKLSTNNMYESLSSSTFIGRSIEAIAYCTGGKKIDVELSISVMRTDKDFHFSASIHDITERKKIENLKSEFIATVSHELRTPLTSIKGSLGLLNGGLVANLPDQAKNLVNLAHKNCNRLLLLINDILDMEKVSSGKMEFYFKNHDLVEMLQNIIDANSAYANNFNVSFQLIHAIPELQVHIDEHRLNQVITNVLSNAAKFSKANGTIDINLALDGQFAKLSIQDYGKGIPFSYQENIWNKFTQADSSSTKEKGGTGLGLAISKSLIEAMNGNIEFESEENIGTIFYILIPLTRQSIAV